ncbi:MAG: uncharacterized protein A8A55_3428, partial [Amphiamblys sp. WSBS2006]
MNFLPLYLLSHLPRQNRTLVYIPGNVLPRVQTGKEKSIYTLDEKKTPRKLDSVHFALTKKNRPVSSSDPVLRFFYDGTEARTLFPDTAREVANTIFDHLTGYSIANEMYVESLSTLSKQQEMFPLSKQTQFFVTFEDQQPTVQAQRYVSRKIVGRVLQPVCVV